MRRGRRNLIFFSIIIIGFLAFARGGTGQEVKYPFGPSDRDPLAPLVSKSGLVLIPREMDFTGLSLKGIIYSKEGAVAIINDEVVREGGSIGDYTVFKIEEKSVILKKGNEGFTLKLEE